MRVFIEKFKVDKHMRKNTQFIGRQAGRQAGRQVYLYFV